MTYRNDTTMGGSGQSFPSTHWSWIEAIRSSETKEHNAALEHLIEVYWKPTYCWLRRHGYNDADAKDRVQGFFLHGLQKGKFGQADSSRGRFRTFFITCLKNFIKNYERDKKAKARYPSKPILPIDKLKTDEIAVELVDKGTPEDSFNRAWVAQLLLRVLKLFKQECEKTERQWLYSLFEQQIIKPILQGEDPPSIKLLADQMGLTEKQAHNRLITARRAYQRLLRQEIRMYASSDDEVAQEIKDLFILLGL